MELKIVEWVSEGHLSTYQCYKELCYRRTIVV